LTITDDWPDNDWRLVTGKEPCQIQSGDIRRRGATEGEHTISWSRNRWPSARIAMRPSYPIRPVRTAVTIAAEKLFWLKSRP